MKGKLIYLAFAVLLVGLVIVGILWKRKPPPVSMKPEAEKAELSFWPEISLSVNNSFETAISPGSPLLFNIVLRNGQAIQAAGAGQARERLTSQLDELAQKGEITRERADIALLQEPGPAVVPSFTISLNPENFSFEQNSPRGRSNVPWKLKMVEPAKSTTATLDDRQFAHAIFVVPPEETLAIAKGAFEVFVSFENRTAGQWQGKIVSDTVVISVGEESSAQSVDERQEKYLILSEYYLAIKNYDQALRAAQKALSVDPNSIEGFIHLGYAKENKGDFRAALESFDKAFVEYRRSYPKSDPPWALMKNISRMREKLGIKLPDVIEEKD